MDANLIAIIAGVVNILVSICTFFQAKEAKKVAKLNNNLLIGQFTMQDGSGGLGGSGGGGGGGAGFVGGRGGSGSGTS